MVREIAMSIDIYPPARYLASSFNPTRVTTAGADVSKNSRGRRSLTNKFAVTIIVAAPALDHAVGFHPA